MNGNLILEDRPLLIIPSLAAMIGLKESIILQQFHYWLVCSKNIRQERIWVYFSYKQLKQQFPFLSISTIRIAISKLEAKDLLTSDKFNNMKM